MDKPRYSLAPTTSTDAPAVSPASAPTRRHASISDRSRSPGQWRRGSRHHLETTGKLLILLESFSTIFSKCALKSLYNQAGFDSAIRRFDPSRPSHLILLGNLTLSRRFILNGFLLLASNSGALYPLFLRLTTYAKAYQFSNRGRSSGERVFAAKMIVERTRAKARWGRRAWSLPTSKDDAGVDASEAESIRNRMLYRHAPGLTGDEVEAFRGRVAVFEIESGRRDLVP
jgi:hypothetical protein